MGEVVKLPSRAIGSRRLEPSPETLYREDIREKGPERARMYLVGYDWTT